MTEVVEGRKGMSPELRKAWGRAWNSLVTIGLAIWAFNSMTHNVEDQLASGVATSTSLAVVWGTGAIALCVAIPRAFVGFAPGGRARLIVWPGAIVVAAGVGLLFRATMDVSWSTFVLAMLTFLGPVVQDWIDG